MLGLLLLGAIQVQHVSEWGYSEKYDIKYFNQKTVYGIVQSVSLHRITIQDLENATELKSYATHRRLSQGLCSYRMYDANAYAISDVRPGDYATLILCEELKAQYCLAISISKRPGGEVPPSRFPKPFCSYAEKQNALNAFNDFGRPFPRYLTKRTAYEYPFANPDVAPDKRLARWPKRDPFSYMEWLLFLR